jgi:uncharacterized protein
MRTTQLLNSTKQLATLVLGAIATVLLLESGGLVVWAKRLEIGPGRTAAVRATLAMQARLHPLGVENLRQKMLVNLQKTGWSDDPAPVNPLSPNASLALACTVPHAIPSPASKTQAKLADTIPQKTTLTPLSPIEIGSPRVAALVGDSMMAVGLSSVLERDSAQNKDLQLLKAFRSGTGLARPDVFDWMAEYPAMLGTAHPDAVIVAIGANDAQDFLDGDKPLKFGTDQWIDVYRQRVQQFLTMLTAGGAHVVWIGLPPMKSTAYNSRVTLLNRIYVSVVSENPNATWWNPAPFIGDENGQYRDFATMSQGKVERLRASDGIHMSLEGASLVSPPLLDWLNPIPPVPATQPLTAALQPAQPIARPAVSTPLFTRNTPPPFPSLHRRPARFPALHFKKRV